MVVHVEKAGKLCLEIDRRILELPLFFVAENAGFREQISVVHSPVMASEAEVGEFGDEVAGICFRFMFIVGEIPDFGRVVLGWGSCVCQEKEFNDG